MRFNIGNKLLRRKPPTPPGARVAELVAELVLWAVRQAWEQQKRRREEKKSWSC